MERWRVEIAQCVYQGTIFYLHDPRVLKEPIALFHNAILQDSISGLFPRKYCIVTGYQNFVGWMVENPNIRHFMSQHGFLIENANLSTTQLSILTMGRVLKSVLLPQQEVLNAMNVIFPNYDSTPFIGVHLRCGGKLSDTPDPSVYLTSEQICDAFHLLQRTEGLLFLSTDSQIVKTNITQYIPVNRIRMNNERVAIVDTQLLRPEKTSRQLLLSVSELMLLGRSRKCYGTSGSTFTLVGCALAQQIPSFVGKGFISLV